MNENVWVKKQEELFELYFNEYGDSVNVEFLINALGSVKEVWQSLYLVFRNELEDFDGYSKVMDVKELECKNNQYLIFKFFPLEYMVVDLNKKCILDEKKVIGLLDEQLFIDNFSEEKVSDFAKYYSFFCGSDLFADSLIDVYRKNKDIFISDNSFHYSLSDGDCRTSVSIDLATLEVVLGFQYLGDVGRCNYIFLDNNLEVYGVSNSDGNMDSLKIMGNRVRDINIPRDRIPVHILRVVLEKENQDKNLGLVKELSCR